MQATIRRELISSQAALELVTKAVRHAEQQGWGICAAVVDPHGHLAALSRTDGCPGPVIEFAIDKAWTAATLGTSTLDFAARMNSSDALRLGASNRPRLCAWPGGVPITVNDQVVGAIGVSGASNEDDITCAEFAIAAVFNR